MMLIRSVRTPQEVARVPVTAYCRALQGAGQDILAAGALPGRQRDAAFRSLTATWLRRGGTDLVPDWKLLLRDVPDARELAREVREDLGPAGAVPPTLATTRQVEDRPEQSELRMVSYAAEHTSRGSRREASAMVHLAVPAEDEGAPWRMHVLRAADPVRLRARTEAFDGAGHVSIDKGGNERETFVVGDDTLTLDARAWSQGP